jgi:hypothetical protein
VGCTSTEMIRAGGGKCSGLVSEQRNEEMARY